MTLAPEEDPDFSLIRYLKPKHHPVNGTHRRGSRAFTKAADAGAVHMTHLFNAMSSFHHREPGHRYGSRLRITAELITDGIHSHPLVKLAYLAKGSQNLIMITDSMRAKGLKDGEYEFGGQKSPFAGTRRFSDGTLRFHFKMNEGAALMRRFTNCSRI